MKWIALGLLSFFLGSAIEAHVIRVREQHQRERRAMDAIRQQQQKKLPTDTGLMRRRIGGEDSAYLVTPVATPVPARP